MTRRINIFALSLAAAAVLAASPARGGALLRESAAAFTAALEEMERIEQGPVPATVADEIARARAWIAAGRKAILQGKNRDAALLAERVGLQLRLIRVLVRAATRRAEADAAAKELEELRREIESLRRRHERAQLEQQGRRLSGAYPAPEGQR